METRLHLTQVSLNCFKAAFALKNVPLRPFNVVIGRNGAGKSTLLEALQWLDTAVRHTTDVACDRYNGAPSLVNNRCTTRVPRFEIETRMEPVRNGFIGYSCRIEALPDRARVAHEELWFGSPESSREKLYLWTKNKARVAFGGGKVVADDRLGLARVDEFFADAYRSLPGPDIAAFWKNAVFLRLEPGDLARNAPLRRSSLEPLLDEVGATLPTLLDELDPDGRESLIEMLQSVLPDVSGVETFRSGDGRFGNYLLTERGADAHHEFRIPSWMLSEGTRRMTAIFALLAHRPGPSLLCIEEVENGLDPVSVRKVLNYLYEASMRGVQVILTTHSPWLLDEVDPEDVLVVRRAQGDTTYTRLQDDPASQVVDPRVLTGGRYIHLLET